MSALNKSVVVAALGLGLWVGLGTGGCIGSGDCNCPQDDLPRVSFGTIIDVASYDAQGTNVQPPVDPAGGSVAVLGDTVELRYEHDGANIAVTYDVHSGSR